MPLTILNTGIINFQGTQREYDVVDRNLSSPHPRYFISYREGLPFISDEVPSDYRNPMVFHELMEFEVLKYSTDRCLNSLLAELETIPQDKRKDYITFRRDVFGDLILFLEKHTPDSPFIPRAKKSWAYLIKAS